MRLFCRLQREVGLSPAEKTEACTHAFNCLVDAIRADASPPLGIRSDRQLERHTVRLHREIETAYNLCPRPANAMIMDLACFSGVGAGPSGAGG
jgi:hypothetical protein